MLGCLGSSPSSRASPRFRRLAPDPRPPPQALALATLSFEAPPRGFAPAPSSGRPRPTPAPSSHPPQPSAGHRSRSAPARCHGPRPRRDGHVGPLSRRCEHSSGASHVLHLWSTYLPPTARSTLLSRKTRRHLQALRRPRPVLTAPRLPFTELITGLPHPRSARRERRQRLRPQPATEDLQSTVDCGATSRISSTSAGSSASRDPSGLWHSASLLMN